jgi:hypothetical protein
MKILGLVFGSVFFLTAPLANAQISYFSVSSKTSPSGNDLQIAGLITSQNSPLTISTTPAAAYSNISGSQPSFNIAPGVGGTVLAWGNDSATTAVTSAPGHIVNCSGRFVIDQPYLPINGDINNLDPTSGVKGSLSFQIVSAGVYSVTVLASGLAPYGLSPAVGVKTTLGGFEGQPINEDGKGTFNLSAGFYTVTVAGTRTSFYESEKQNGNVLVSIDAI